MIKRFGSEGPTQFQPPAEGWLTPTNQAAPPGTAVKASVGGPKEERRGGTRAAQRHCARRRCCLGNAGSSGAGLGSGCGMRAARLPLVPRAASPPIRTTRGTALRVKPQCGGPIGIQFCLSDRRQICR